MLLLPWNIDHQNVCARGQVAGIPQSSNTVLLQSEEWECPCMFFQQESTTQHWQQGQASDQRPPSLPLPSGSPLVPLSSPSLFLHDPQRLPFLLGPLSTLFSLFSKAPKAWCPVSAAQTSPLYSDSYVQPNTYIDASQASQKKSLSCPFLQRPSKLLSSLWLALLATHDQTAITKSFLTPFSLSIMHFALCENYLLWNVKVRRGDILAYYKYISRI